MFSTFIQHILLKQFFRIELSGIELQTAEESIKKKYTPATRDACILTLFIVPAIVTLETTTLVTVLIPISTVTGVAWFSISLSHVKKKFEQFGLELTTALYRAFLTSLFLLGLLACFSFFPEAIMLIHSWNQTTSSPIVNRLTGIFATIAVLIVLWDVYRGSLSYDINDSMLAGQAEVAEKYYKRSLSLLYLSAEHLRLGKGLGVANYYLGSALSEIFSFITINATNDPNLQAMLTKAKHLKQNPTIDQTTADELCASLVRQFLTCCTNIQGEKSIKHFRNIQSEIAAITDNHEPQMIIDTRFSVIFEDIAELLELQGEGLFRKKQT